MNGLSFSRLMVIAGADERATCPGSTVRTDIWPAYLGLEGYVHDRQARGHQDEEEHLLPRVHRVIALLKRWLLGTHQGAIAQEHLDAYLDEFTFRFNCRTSKSCGNLFYRLAQQAVQAGLIPSAPLAKPQPMVHGGVKQIPLIKKIDPSPSTSTPATKTRHGDPARAKVNNRL